MTIVTIGTIVIEVNNETGPLKKNSRVLDRLTICPFLFDLDDDGLSIMIDRVMENNLLSSLLTHTTYGGVPILQYADDIILLFQNDLEH